MGAAARGVDPAVVADDLSINDFASSTILGIDDLAVADVVRNGRPGSSAASTRGSEQTAASAASAPCGAEAVTSWEAGRRSW